MQQALNYRVDRDGIVALLDGTAEPAVGFYEAFDPLFGKPENCYRHPARGHALLANTPGRIA